MTCACDSHTSKVNEEKKSKSKSEWERATQSTREPLRCLFHTVKLMCIYLLCVRSSNYWVRFFPPNLYKRRECVCASCWTKHTMCSTRKWDLVQIIFTPVTMVNGSFDVWWVNSRRFLFWFQSFFKWYTYDWYQGRRVWFSEFYVSQIEMRINLCMPFVTLGGQRIQIRIVAWKCMQWHIAHIQKCWRKGTLRVIP